MTGLRRSFFAAMGTRVERDRPARGGGSGGATRDGPLRGARGRPQPLPARVRPQPPQPLCGPPGAGPGRSCSGRSRGPWPRRGRRAERSTRRWAPRWRRSATAAASRRWPLGVRTRGTAGAGRRLATRRGGPRGRPRDPSARSAPGPRRHRQGDDGRRRARPAARRGPALRPGERGRRPGRPRASPRSARLDGRRADARGPRTRGARARGARDLGGRAPGVAPGRAAHGTTWSIRRRAPRPRAGCGPRRRWRDRASGRRPRRRPRSCSAPGPGAACSRQLGMPGLLVAPSGATLPVGQWPRAQAA